MDKIKLADQLIEQIRQDFFDTLDRVYPLESYHNGELPNRGALAVHLMSVVRQAAEAGFDAAESIANAKIQELEREIQDRKDAYDAIDDVNIKLNHKITELEQQLKDEKCFNDAGSKELVELNNENSSLKEKLKKAESVIEQLNIFNDAWATQESPEIEILRNSSRIKMLKLLHKYNEQYLKSRGE